MACQNLETLIEEDTKMPHVYGHNPYVEEYDPFEFTTEFSGPYMGDFTGDVGEWSLSHYGYQGMTQR